MSDVPQYSYVKNSMKILTVLRETYQKQRVSVQLPMIQGARPDLRLRTIGSQGKLETPLTGAQQ